MEPELSGLSGTHACKGHFLLESGYHSGLRLDLDPLFVLPARIGPFVEALALNLKGHGIQPV